MTLTQSVITACIAKLQAKANAEPCTYRKWQLLNAIRIMNEMKGVV